VVWHTACAADSKLSNRHVTFDSNRDVRFEFESNLEASQVPIVNIVFLLTYLLTYCNQRVTRWQRGEVRLLVSVTSNQGVARGSQLIAQKSRKGDRIRRRVAAGVTEYNSDASDRTATREDAPSFVLSAVLLDTLAPAASYPGSGWTSGLARGDTICPAPLLPTP